MSKHRYPGRACLVAAMACCALVLAACGGSSTPRAATTATTAANDAGGNGPRFAAARACLQKQGITLPQRPPGAQRPGGPGGVPGGNLFNPGPGAGANAARRAQFNTPAFQAAARKCGLTLRRFRANPAARRAAINNFVACVRKNGYNLPAPNFSGKGPVFQAAQVNQKDPKFVAASQKCQSLLRPAGPGAGGGPPGAVPPAGATPVPAQPGTVTQ